MEVFLPDVEVARVAAMQENVISTDQLHDIGLKRSAIEHRANNGRLHRVHRGVYVVGVCRLTPRGRLWAAVLACGGPEAAAISHVTAAAVWRIRDGWPSKVDVATFGTSRSTRAIRVHHTLTLDDLAHHRGLPITTPARTLADSTPLLDDDGLLRACSEARYLGLIGADPTGPPRLRRALERLSLTGPQRTKTELEHQFLALVARHDLPPPLVNVPLHGFTVDFLWPEHKVVVETDGRNHLRPHVYETDRLRDAVLQDHGYRPYRVTARELDEHPQRVVARLRRWLA